MDDIGPFVQAPQEHVPEIDRPHALGYLLEPGETDTVSYACTLPDQTGTYRLWAGGRLREALAARSPPIESFVD